MAKQYSERYVKRLQKEIANWQRSFAQWRDDLYEKGTRIAGLKGERDQLDSLRVKAEKDLEAVVEENDALLELNKAKVAKIAELVGDLETETEEGMTSIRQCNRAHEVIVEQALELSALRRELKNTLLDYADLEKEKAAADAPRTPHTAEGRRARHAYQLAQVGPSAVWCPRSSASIERG